MAVFSSQLGAEAFAGSAFGGGAKGQKHETAHAVRRGKRGAK